MRFAGQFSRNGALKRYLRTWLIRWGIERIELQEDMKQNHDEFTQGIRDMGVTVNASMWLDLTLSLIDVPDLAFFNAAMIFSVRIFTAIRTNMFPVNGDERLAVFLERWKNLVDPDLCLQSQILDWSLGIDCMVRETNLLEILINRYMLQSAIKILVPYMVNSSYKRQCIIESISLRMSSKEHLQCIVDYVMQHGGVNTLLRKQHRTFSHWQDAEQKALVLWNLTSKMTRVMPRVLWSICVDYLICSDSKRFYCME
jgi:hypothetical protein